MRSTIPDLTAERLANRMSIWMLSAAQGNAQAIDRIETTAAVLTVVGFSPEIINHVIASAAREAGETPTEAVERFGVNPPAPKAPRKPKA